MKKLALILIFLISCTSGEHTQWMSRDGKIKILSTTAIVDDMVGEIGGEHVDRVVLIKGALNPHSYELVKGDDEKLAFADLIFYSGLGLEHGPSLAAYLKQDERAVGVGNVIAAEEPGAILFVDGQVDPHIWMDVSLWAVGSKGVVAALCEIDPEHAEEYRVRGEAYCTRLQILDHELRDKMLTVQSEKRYLITSHDAFNYFSRRYLATDQEQIDGNWAKRCTAPEGLAPEGQLSTTDIQNVIDHLVAYHIEVLFPESNLNRDSIRKIEDAGRHKGLVVRIADHSLYGDAMGTESYEKMMSHNVQVIKENLD